MTESEALFVRFCERRGWKVDRIDARDVARGIKVPDFRVRARGDVSVIVEVKEFCRNPDEEEEERRIASGEIVVTGTKPGRRLRGVISKANRQLKAHGMREPGMLVVYDRTGGRQHTHPYSVLTAARGLDTIPVYVKAETGTIVGYGPAHPGGGKKLTAEGNRSVSCIAVLNKVWPARGQTEEGPHHTLDVYHNRHATHPLSPGDFVGRGVTHYRLKSDDSDWELVDGLIFDRVRADVRPCRPQKGKVRDE